MKCLILCMAFAAGLVFRNDNTDREVFVWGTLLAGAVLLMWWLP